MLTRYLQKAGYTVLGANDGQEGLELLSRGEKVDAIVCDAVMPRMSGRALFDVVSRERPELPFLFCSGFPAGTITRDLLAAPHRALLPKPFSEDALLRELARLLEAARRPNA
jgi:CheY-like chemotaxis protein